jgi:hypothetical protein
VVDQAISNTGGDGKLHVLLDADNNNGARDGGGIVILNNDIATGGGNLSFGTGATLLLNGVVTLVGGDVYVAGAGARSIATGGGNLAVNGEMIIANTSGLGITTGNGSVTFGGMVNSGNTYAGVGFAGKTWSEALANAASGSGLNAGDTYLATITTRLENALASRANSYNQGWLGGRRVTGIGSDLTWRWVTGRRAPWTEARDWPSLRRTHSRALSRTPRTERPSAAPTTTGTTASRTIGTASPLLPRITRSTSRSCSSRAPWASGTTCPAGRWSRSPRIH